MLQNQSLQNDEVNQEQNRSRWVDFQKTVGIVIWFLIALNVMVVMRDDESHVSLCTLLKDLIYSLNLQLKVESD